MIALIARDLRRGLAGAAWLPIAFFLLVAVLIPFAVGPDARLLSRIGAGSLWIAALTAALLPVERLIEPDRADGTLDQLSLHGMAEESVATAKIIAHWLSFAPLLLLAARQFRSRPRGAEEAPLPPIADNPGRLTARLRAARERLDRMTKPPGSLGRLEDLAIWLAVFGLAYRRRIFVKI